MISTLNKYIAWKVFLGILGAFVIITSVIMLVDFVETSRNFDQGVNVGMATILYITALNAPQLVEQTIPFVVLFGVMGALFTLNKNSELIVMRASGLSAWKFLKPAILLTGFIGILWPLAFNPLAASAGKKHQRTLSSLAKDTQAVVQRKGIWLREGSDEGYLVIHAKSSDISAHKLLDVTFFYTEFGQDGRSDFTTRYDADSAEFMSKNAWVLRNVVEREDGKLMRKYDTVSKSTTITWQSLQSQVQTHKHPPFWKLQSEIKSANQAGFDTTVLTMQFHKLLALPITLIAMAVIAAAASLKMARSGGTLRLMIAGGMLGFGVYFVDNIISAFGEIGVLPPALAAWSVPILVLCCGLAYMSKIEDG